MTSRRTLSVLREEAFRTWRAGTAVAPERPKHTYRGPPPLSSRRSCLALDGFCGWRQVATLGADEEAVARLRRSIEINRTFPLAHFFLAAALADLGKLDEAQAETRGGLTLDPTFTILRFRAGQESDNPIFLAGKERIIEGMRKAGVPEG